MERRSFLLGALGSLTLPAGAEESRAAPSREAVYVPAGEDRRGEHRIVLSGLEVDFKVSSEDTDGRLFVIEHTDPHPGGPPRHLHRDQDEWFRVLEGRYVLEVGDEVYRLGPGDSVLAPRQVPHVWAHVGDGEGKLIIGFQPAGSMEAFLIELSRIEGVPPPAVMRELFLAHGMEIVGPPLAVQ